MLFIWATKVGVLLCVGQLKWVSFYVEEMLFIWATKVGVLLCTAHAASFRSHGQRAQYHKVLAVGKLTGLLD